MITVVVIVSSYFEDSHYQYFDFEHRLLLMEFDFGSDRNFLEIGFDLTEMSFVIEHLVPFDELD